MMAMTGAGYLRTVFAEAARVASGKPIWYHAWYEYMLQGAPSVPQKPSCVRSPDGQYAPNCTLSRENLDVMLQVPKQVGVSGVVIWGAGADQSSAVLCKLFRSYFFETLGPAVASAMTKSPPPTPARPSSLAQLIMPPVEDADPTP